MRAQARLAAIATIGYSGAAGLSNSWSLARVQGKIPGFQLKNHSYGLSGKWRIEVAKKPASEDEVLKCLARHFSQQAFSLLLLGRGDDCAVLKTDDHICISSDLFWRTFISGGIIFLLAGRDWLQGAGRQYKRHCGLRCAASCL